MQKFAHRVIHICYIDLYFHLAKTNRTYRILTGGEQGIRVFTSDKQIFSNNIVFNTNFDPGIMFL